MTRTLVQRLAAPAFLCLGLGSRLGFAIDTVDELVVSKYIGRWYQAYGNEITAKTITRDSTCIAADYGLDEATGNITVINSDREHFPTGELNTISGYAYGTDKSKPGQLKVHLGQVPVDGDYWVVGLGPDTFGPDGLYEWAVVSGPEAASLFILVRDVPRFEKMFLVDVLDFVKELGFTGPTKEPQRIIQEGCLPFDPVSIRDGKKEGKKLGWIDVLAEMGSQEPWASTQNEGGEVDRKHENKEGQKLGWIDALSEMASYEDWATAQDEDVDVDEGGKKLGWIDALAEIGSHPEWASEGAESMEVDERRDPEGKKLGWADALYEMASLEDWAAVQNEDVEVDEKRKDIGWIDVLAEMEWGEEEEAAYAEHLKRNKAAKEDDVNGVTKFLEDLEQARAAGPNKGWKPVVPVTALDMERYTGRWYQAYGSLTVTALLEQKGACVTADYAKKDDGTVSVVNTARAKKVEGELVEMKGYAYYTDKTAPGKLTVHLDGVPTDAPYWVLALGSADKDGPYSWSIVSDPLRAFLFVLVRDVEGFHGSQDEADLLAKCKELGFTSFWNAPIKTEQEGCEYPDAAKSDSAVVPESLKKSPLTKLRGGALLGPLHASCKMSVKFPKNGCKDVKDALVSAAENMSGFDSCNGGNKCGYSVSKVSSGGLDLVHETSVKHYKDDMKMTFTDSDNESKCEAKAFSTSQIWYAVLDDSVNYCNIHNLVDSSGLEYEEADVNDSVCTQYSSANCERY